MSKRIFYLTGFMASGKSTVGPILANTIGWDFFDLDKEIEKTENKKITSIFEKNGEAYFRILETKVLRKLSSGKKIIIALGGGTLIIPENLKIIKDNGKLIYLKCSPEMAFKRLKHKGDRPVLLAKNNVKSSRESLTKKIADLMQEREQYYSLADYCIDTNTNNIGKTVDLLAKLIQKN